MLTFLAVAVAGSATGLLVAREHLVSAGSARSRRALATWLHILAFWPLPLLLVLHVVTVYAY
jgi:nitrite reductase (NADH) large subunit